MQGAGLFGLIVLFGLWLSFMGIADRDGPQVLLGLFVCLFGSLAWRLFCEAWIVFFRIHEALVSIDKKLGRQ